MERNLEYGRDVTFVPQPQLVALTQRLPTPFYLYDQVGISRTYKELMDEFSSFPGYGNDVAIRHNPNPHVIALLHRLGCGLICATEAELELVKGLGISGERVIFWPMYPQCKPLQTLCDLGGTLVVDSPSVGLFAWESNLVPPHVTLCCNTVHNLKNGATTVARPERSKLGMGQSDLALVAKRLAKSGAKTLGLCAQLHHYITSAHYHGAVLEYLWSVKKQLEQTARVQVDYLHLGGGLAGRDQVDFIALRQGIADVAKQIGMDEGFPIRTELSRSLLEAHGVFVTKIVAVKESLRRFLVVDGSVATLPIAPGSNLHHLSIADDYTTANRAFFDVVGCIPDINDRIIQRKLLPQAKVGQCCVVHHVGYHLEANVTAYGRGRPCGSYLYLENGSLLSADDNGMF